MLHKIKLTCAVILLLVSFSAAQDDLGQLARRYTDDVTYAPQVAIYNPQKLFYDALAFWNVIAALRATGQLYLALPTEMFLEIGLFKDYPQILALWNVPNLAWQYRYRRELMEAKEAYRRTILFLYNYATPSDRSFFDMLLRYPWLLEFYTAVSPRFVLGQWRDFYQRYGYFEDVAYGVGNTNVILNTFINRQILELQKAWGGDYWSWYRYGRMLGWW